MKFISIANPPYNGDLHLKILYRLFDFSEKIVTVEPAGFLLNFHENSKHNKPGGLSDNIKKRMEHHTPYIELNNFNLDFEVKSKTAYTMPYIDFTKTYETIKFKKVNILLEVKTIDDVNLVGSKKNVQNILKKCKDFPIHIKDRFVNLEKYKEYEKPGTYFLRSTDQIGDSIGFTIRQKNKTKENWPYYIDYPVIRTHRMYFQRIFENTNILDKVPIISSGNQYHPKGAPHGCIYGTYEELSNLIYNVTHCKLFCFIQICICICTTSNTKPFTPWIADKHYTDQEIYNLLNINQEEQELIDNTLNLYSADTEFFQNYFRIETAYENKK